MDLTNLFESLLATLGESLPSVLGALLILVIGWLVALVIRAAVRKGLNLLRIDERVGTTTGSDIDIASGFATVAYYVVLLVVLVAFFNALKLERVSGTLQSLVDQIFAYLPKLGAGVIVLLVAWVIATILRSIVRKALAATSLDDRLSGEAGMRPVSENLGNVLYWLVILLFLPAVLGAFGMAGLLEPVEGMVDGLLAMLPNVLAAAAIALVGWFVARILRDLVTNLLSAAGVDRLGERAGLRGTTTLSGLLGLIVYIFIFVPALVAALNALKVDAISAPATEMLGTFMGALPNLFGAALILAVAWFVSSFIANLVANLLGGMGFDRLPARLGVGKAVRSETTPSQLVGKVVVFFVMLFAVVEAANRLGFGQVSDLVGTMIGFGGQVLLGIAIIAVGVWISNVAHSAMTRVSGGTGAPAAGLARFAILGIVIAMGLRAMGLADDIVNLAFGLTLGAVAVAVALSFGLGGREAAGRQMEYWLSRLRGE
ncbi:MAG TPA: mechanosensitive ion channel [Myxococcota bacterium]